jgi:hypothetical protein
MSGPPFKGAIRRRAAFSSLAITYLGSPGAHWITGQDIQVDAGFIKSMIAGPPIQL